MECKQGRLYGLFLFFLLVNLASSNSDDEFFESISDPSYFKDTLVVPLKKKMDYYYGEIGIGTPPQMFNMLFDTAKSEIWVRSSNFFVGGYSDMHAKYKSFPSKTYKKNGTRTHLKYKSDVIFGFYSNDNVKVDHLTIENQDFVEVIRIHGTQYADAFYDGVLGLGFQEAAFDNSIPIWLNMINHDLLKKNMFSFWLSRNFHKDNKEGEIIFGGLNPKHFNGIHTYFPLVKNGAWMIKMSGVFVGDEPIGNCENGCFALIDSGKNIVTGPNHAIALINRALGASASTKQGKEGQPEVDCKKVHRMPTISFAFENKRFELSPNDYIIRDRTAYMPHCFSGFQSINIPDTDTRWILGTPFMRRYHTIFDYENLKIGFAESV